MAAAPEDVIVRFLLRHWYDIGGVLIIPVVFWAIFGNLSTVQLILVLNLGVIFWHQFEEYRFPGGEPWVLNEAFMKPSGHADRLPTNEVSGIWINVSAWVLYFLAAVFPDLIWLGLAPILMGFPAQFVVHGIITTRKLKFFYNPGLAAVVFGHTPLAIWYVIVVYQQGLIHWWDWIFGLLILGFFMGFVMQVVGFRLIAPRAANTHPYTPDEYNKWDRERRLRRVGIEPGVVPSPLVPEDTQSGVNK